jgi:hypothetical protein
MRRAVLNAMRACRSDTPATMGTCADGGPSMSAQSPSECALAVAARDGDDGSAHSGREDGLDNALLPRPKLEPGARGGRARQEVGDRDGSGRA